MQIFADKQFECPIEIIQAFDNESFIEAFSKLEKFRKCPDYHLLGYIRYEAKDVFLGKEIKSDLPLLYFEAYDEKQERGDRKQVINKNVHPFTCSPVHLISYENYKESIEKIKSEIAEGNTYQVNFTYDNKILTKLDGFELYNSILPNQKTPYNAYIKNKYEEILCFSPELFFELEGDKIKTKPMKGTVQRGETPEIDLKNVEFLKKDEKNRAENVMIVDLLRNDLGRMAKAGTVKVDKLFEVETHKTVHQMTSEISAELEDGRTLYDIFEAIFPCGSVTGAPKISTMEIIERLEEGKRGVYCGAIGYINGENAVFCVPIRTLQKRIGQNEFSCRVGGAIVWDSTAEDEWAETLTKLKFLGYIERYPEFISGSHGLYNMHDAFNNAMLKQVQHDVRGGDFSLVETILVENGELKYEKEHFLRMEKSAKELGFEFSKADLDFVIDGEARQYKQNNNAILRFLLDKSGNFEVQGLPLEPVKTNKVSLSKNTINSKEPLLYHKTTFRPWYEEAMEKIKSGEVFDVIFFNERGELTEGARSNVILQIEGRFYTPPVSCGLLNGIVRGKVLSEKNPHPEFLTFVPHSEIHPSPLKGEWRFDNIVIEKNLYLEDLNQAEKVFCINSVRGVVEVKL